MRIDPGRRGARVAYCSTRARGETVQCGADVPYITGCTRIGGCVNVTMPRLARCR